jgi:hypothetical protein
MGCAQDIYGDEVDKFPPPPPPPCGYEHEDGYEDYHKVRTALPLLCSTGLAA